MANESMRAAGVDTVRSLYKSLASCSEHHPLEILGALHIPTPIDDAIVLAAHMGKVVIVTGNPGDGKTHLIRKVLGEFNKRVMVRQDANEAENSELIAAISDAVSEKRSLVLAINEGILLEICEEAKSKHPWATTVGQAVLRPYGYGRDEIKEMEQIVIVDLNMRNNLSEQVVAQAIERLAALIAIDSACSGSIAWNLERLRNPDVVDRVCKLLAAVGRTGFHATMRDLLGFVAFLLCGDRTDDEASPPYFMGAFEGGQGPLFDEVRQLDPLLVPSPFLDDQLYMAEDQDSHWIIRDPDEVKTREDVEAFRRRKRRAFFEHREGLSMLREERNDVEKTFRQLRRAEQSPEQVAIRLLNRFFDSRETLSDRLILWTGHQFDARPARFVAARQVASATELKIRVPELPTHLLSVFPDHHPDHVILCHSALPVGDGLVLDRRLVTMLIAGDRLSGLGTRNLEAQTKIAAFFDRLARVSGHQQNIVQVLRLDNMAKARIGVNVSSKDYYIPGGVV